MMWMHNISVKEHMNALHEINFDFLSLFLDINLALS